MADFVTLVARDGVSHAVNPDRVADVFPDPTSPATRAILVMVHPPGVQQPPYLVVNGTAAAVAAILAAPSGGGLNGSYNPAISDLGGFYTPAQSGLWLFQRIQNRVRVSGLMTLDPPTTPPFGQFDQINFSLPVPRTTNFASTEECPGVCQWNGTTPAPGWAVNIGASPIRSLAGTLDFAFFNYVCDSNVGGLDVAITCEYDVL